MIWLFGEVSQDCQIKTRQFMFAPMAPRTQITNFKFCQYQQRVGSPNWKFNVRQSYPLYRTISSCYIVDYMQGCFSLLCAWTKQVCLFTHTTLLSSDRVHPVWGVPLACTASALIIIDISGFYTTQHPLIPNTAYTTGTCMAWIHGSMVERSMVARGCFRH